MSIYITSNAANQHIAAAGVHAAQARLLLIRSRDTRTRRISEELTRLIEQICKLGGAPHSAAGGQTNG